MVAVKFELGVALLRDVGSTVPVSVDVVVKYPLSVAAGESPDTSSAVVVGSTGDPVNVAVVE